MEALTTNAEVIVGLMLGQIEEAGTGIYRKQLDSGREVFSCKCPVCGTIHGGYRTYAEAAAHRKCRQHYRTEIEKLRKEVEKVDEPRKQKNIFQHPLNKAAVIGEAGEDEDFGPEDEDWRDVAEPEGDAVAYAISEFGKEVYPVSYLGLIGRRGWSLNDMSGEWKVEGIVPLFTDDYISWPELRDLLDHGEDKTGHIVDRDHGTLRQWGSTARIYKTHATSPI